MATNRGQFITIEGSEGVGKSTNIAFMQQVLQARGIDLLVTREPGGTPLAEEIRDTLLQKRHEVMDETVELLLMFAARAQHLNHVIIPALARGQWVLCDRFTDSTYAYQGGGRRLDQALIRQLEHLVQRGLQPDLTVYLDIDVRLGLARVRKRDESDRFENETLDFFERVRATYLERARAEPQRYRIIDASQALEDVQKDILLALYALLEQSREQNQGDRLACK